MGQKLMKLRTDQKKNSLANNFQVKKSDNSHLSRTDKNAQTI